MPGLTPPPPTQTLDALEDVDLAAGQPLDAQQPRLQWDDPAKLWTPKVPTPFDGLATSQLPNAWQDGSFATGTRTEAISGSPNLLHGDRLYRIGGIMDPTPGPTTEIGFYDLTDGMAYTKVGDTTDVEGRTVAAIIGSSLYGLSGPTEFGVWTIDGGVWTDLTDPSGSGMSGAPNHMIAHGGRLFVGMGDVNDGYHWRYDPFDDSWAQLANRPTRHLFGVALAAQGQLFFLGEEASAGSWRYDPADDSWAAIAAWPDAAAENAPAVGVYHSGLIYAAAGTEVWVYSPALDAWDKLDTVCPVDVGQGTQTGSRNDNHVVGIYHGRWVLTHRWEFAIYG